MVISNSAAIVIKKIAAGLFLWPLFCLFYGAIANNLPNIWSGLFVIAYITVFSFGLPVWMIKAAKRMYCLAPKGDKYIRYLSLFLLSIFVAFIVVGRDVPPEIICSHNTNLKECAERVANKPMFDGLAISILATYIFTFAASFLKTEKPHAA